MKIKKVIVGTTFAPNQEQWNGRIRDHVRENPSPELEDFDPVLIFLGGRLGA